MTTLHTSFGTRNPFNSWSRDENASLLLSAGETSSFCDLLDDRHGETAMVTSKKRKTSDEQQQQQLAKAATLTSMKTHKKMIRDQMPLPTIRQKKNTACKKKKKIPTKATKTITKSKRSPRRRECPAKKEYLEAKPRNIDIVSGKGGESNHHEGNQTIFWPLILLHRMAYLLADRIAQETIVDMVIQGVEKREGKPRFVEQDKSTGKYYLSPDKNKRSKVRQALRDKYIPILLHEEASSDPKYRDVWARYLEHKAARAEKNYGNKKILTTEKSKPKTQKAPVANVAQPVLAIKNRDHAAVTGDKDGDTRDQSRNARQDDDESLTEESCLPRTTNPAEFVMSLLPEAFDAGSDVISCDDFVLCSFASLTSSLNGKANSSSNSFELGASTLPKGTPPPVITYRLDSPAPAGSMKRDSFSLDRMFCFSYGPMQTSIDYFFDQKINNDPIEFLKEDITDLDDPIFAIYFQPMPVPSSTE